jgi:SAM-dependent methyltransferase
MTSWDDRYAATPNLFGDTPSPLLLEYRHLLSAGMQALAIGDGEGRNGVWLAQQGLDVLSIDLSTVALERARQRAISHGVALRTLCMDILAWEWPRTAFDLVTLMFVHLPAAQRRRLHLSIMHTLKPGGLCLLECFHRDQIGYASGGPADAGLLYTLESIEQDFAGIEIVKLARVETDVVLGGESKGNGAAVHFVGRKPPM